MGHSNKKLCPMFLVEIFMILLQFIPNIIYFNKLIDIYINRQESQKVVDNYFNGTNNKSVRTN